LDIANENMPANTKEIGTGEDNDDQSEDFVDLDQHQSFQDGVRFALDVVLYGCLQDFVVMVVDALLDAVNVQELEQSRHSEQLEQPIQSSVSLSTSHCQNTIEWKASQ
jgi:hypothetical protein